MRQSQLVLLVMVIFVSQQESPFYAQTYRGDIRLVSEGTFIVAVPAHTVVSIPVPVCKYAVKNLEGHALYHLL